MKTVVMIPAFNEANNIGNVIKDIPRNLTEKVEVLVVDDGSRDNTKEIAELSGANKVISHYQNKGLGITFRDGLKTALGMDADIIVNIDADGQFNPKDIPKLIEPILNKEADMVTGTRFFYREPTQRMPGIKILGNKMFTKLINITTHQRFTDTQCGFRAYSREAASGMTLFGGYTYTQEVFLDLLEKGFIIKEIPCHVARRKGRSRLVTNVFSYGFKAISIIFRSMLYYRPLKFFGSFGLFITLIGFIINFWLLIRLILINQIYPFLSLAYVATAMIFFGIFLIFLALIADMLDRQRKILEEVLKESRMKKK